MKWGHLFLIFFSFNGFAEFEEDKNDMAKAIFSIGTRKLSPKQDYLGLWQSHYFFGDQLRLLINGHTATLALKCQENNDSYYALVEAPYFINDNFFEIFDLIVHQVKMPSGKFCQISTEKFKRLKLEFLSDKFLSFIVLGKCQSYGFEKILEYGKP